MAVKDEPNAHVQFRMHESDTGSPQVQVGLLTDRITRLSEHLKSHKKDCSSRQGLLQMVSSRRRLLEYLKRHNEPAYRSVIEALNLRK
jgi:small subunit ribosomal protein S15